MALKWFREAADRFEGELRWNEPLSKHTYYQIGGPADLLVIPKGLADLKIVCAGLQETAVPFFILGAGSNLLVSDRGFNGLVIKTSKLNLEIREKKVSSDELEITVGSSVPNSVLLSKAMREGWAGLEFLMGIPGTTGGAVFMNAGTHLGESESALCQIQMVNLLTQWNQPQEVSRDQMKFEYRRNHWIQPEYLVWSATWKAKRDEPSAVKARVEGYLQKRKASQPIEMPSCGSVFKNPKASGLHAWQVIDQLRLRGLRSGQAGFSEKHCNFIVNYGGAQAKDVKNLIDLAKRRAQEELGILLEEEVRFLGDFST